MVGRRRRHEPLTSHLNTPLPPSTPSPLLPPPPPPPPSFSYLVRHQRLCCLSSEQPLGCAWVIAASTRISSWIQHATAVVQMPNTWLDNTCVIVSVRQRPSWEYRWFLLCHLEQTLNSVIHWPSMKVWRSECSPNAVQNLICHNTMQFCPNLLP